MSDTFEGVLQHYFETGMEGSAFSLQRDGFVDERGYLMHEGLVFIKPQDHLVIKKDNEIVWEGVVQATYNRSSGPDQMNLKGYYVHWLPTNVDHDLWYDVFFEYPEKYRGIITKKRE